MSSEILYYIYRLICPITGDIKYIGQTKRPARRKIEHRCYHGSGGRNNRYDTYKQFLKQHKAKFIFEIITQTPDKEEANRLETDLIASHKNLLNLAPGGDYIVTDHHTSRTTKGKTFEDVYGVPYAKYIKYLISVANRGPKNSNFGGAYCTPEWSEKQRTSQSKKPLLVLDTYTGVFDTYRNSKEAAQAIGCNAGRVRTSKQYGWNIKRRYSIMDQ